MHIQHSSVGGVPWLENDGSCLYPRQGRGMIADQSKSVNQVGWHRRGQVTLSHACDEQITCLRVEDQEPLVIRHDRYAVRGVVLECA